jgi:hypothetical protein
VHLAVDAHDGAVRFDDHGGVVIQPGRALFEQRGDHDRPVFASQRAQRIGRGAWDGLGQPEKPVVLDLAEVLRPEQLLGADDASAAFHGALGEPQLMLEVGGRVGAARHLGEADTNDAGRRRSGAAGSHRSQAYRTPAVLFRTPGPHRQDRPGASMSGWARYAAQAQ